MTKREPNDWPSNVQYISQYDFKAEALFLREARAYPKKNKIKASVHKNRIFDKKLILYTSFLVI